MTKKKYPSPRLEREVPFLNSLMNAHSHPRLRQQLLQHANKDQINAISEVVLNTLKSNVPLDPPLMARLRRYKDPLRQVGRPRTSVARRRNVLLQQKGKGFWIGLKEVCRCTLPP